MKIEAENIKLSFGEKEILKGVSVHVEDGEFVGLIGPNGSGKSTLLKCIYRVLTPDSGEIRLDGHKLTDMKYKDSALKLAVVSQHNFYNFDFSVLEVVLMGRAPHKRAMERDNALDAAIARKCLEKTGMLGFIDRNFSTLSGGEQQRVILARALTQETPAMILDEPTNHLDITHQLGLMKTVKEEKGTVLSAIHDLNIAARFCDRLYVLQSGKIIAEGTPEEILTPKLLKDVYEVDAEIVRDSRGQMQILFL